ncbi:hypothetical protein [Arthrobacter sp. M4]|uniref:hypothetical protein n=1 Tax=Arthrobacter sp. M4 TaxID=218160 RepID=UPI001CDBC761|nr:hypothetical protein [Arthrobacter sp. M4]MCA4132954.1 hypothetical protein [Arthrobacter sp. M4]
MPTKAIRYVTTSAAAVAGSAGTVAKAAAGTIGTAAVAAAGAMAAAAVAASVVLSPVQAAEDRMEGVRSDLQRAVALNQITVEHAERFEAKLAGRILGDA